MPFLSPALSTRLDLVTLGSLSVVETCRDGTGRGVCARPPLVTVQLWAPLALLCAMHAPICPDEERTARGCLHSGVNDLRIPLLQVCTAKGRGSASSHRLLGRRHASRHRLLGRRHIGTRVCRWRAAHRRPPAFVREPSVVPTSPPATRWHHLKCVACKAGDACCIEQQSLAVMQLRGIFGRDWQVGT